MEDNLETDSDGLEILTDGFILFAVYLMTFSAAKTTQHQIRRLVKNKLERIWKEMVMASFEYYSCRCLDGLKKTMKNVCCDS
jgi:hypothetical protein